jgi:Arc/MetJ-type ribon-helix-helix transcriptional regulator
MPKTQATKLVKRLNTTLPDPLAHHVGEMSGKGGLYETPSEFIRDLVRRHMEGTEGRERSEINALLAKSLSEHNYSEWSDVDLTDARNIAKD